MSKDYPEFDIEEPDGIILPDGGRWVPEKELQRGKSGRSTLCRRQEGPGGMPRRAVLKEFREHAQNYIPLEKALSLEIESREILDRIGIDCPEILGISRKHNALLKEYLSGETLMEMLCRGPLAHEHISAVHELARRAARQGYNIDFFPANFVFSGGDIRYIDFEVQPYSEEWNFERWGLWYYFNPEGFARFAADGDGDHINEPGTPLPRKDGEIRRRRTDYEARLPGHE